SPQVFQPGLTVHKYPIRALQHDVLEQIPKESALRARTAATPLADSAHHQEPNAMVLKREPLRNIIHARIEPEESLQRSEALLNQILHSDQGRRGDRKS